MSDGEAGTDLERGFGLLGDATRVAILRAVWAADTEVVSFGDLRTAVGSPDSGRFNYHLGKLEDHFLVARAEGYALTPAGREVVRALLAGTLTDHPSLAPAELDATCADCGATLVAGYETQGVVECPVCDTTVLRNEFPPAGLTDREVDEFARALDRWVHHRFRLAADGICPNCARSTVLDLPDPDGDHPATVHRCGHCDYVATIPLFAHAMAHPAVISLYHEAGVDVTAEPYWALRHRREDCAVGVTGDPWTARVTVATTAGSVTIEYDPNLTGHVVDL